jgi:hypothetical protein
MASNNTVRVGTYGRDVEINTKIDLTAFDGGTAIVELHVERPDKTETIWSALFKDGLATSMILVHTLVSGDLDQVGDYLVLSHVRDPNSSPPVWDLGTDPWVLTVQSKFKKS